MTKFKKGDKVDIGYCRAEIIGESFIKGFEYIIRLDPRVSDCYGSWRLNGVIKHVTEKVASRFVLLKNTDEVLYDR